MKDLKIMPIEKNGNMVLTTAQLAEAYDTDSKVISKNFTRNKDHYIEGKHYYCLTGEDLKEFKRTNRQIDEQFKSNTENFGVVNKRTPCLYLWTEKGALLHAKNY